MMQGAVVVSLVSNKVFFWIKQVWVECLLHALQQTHGIKNNAIGIALHLKEMLG